MATAATSQLDAASADGFDLGSGLFESVEAVAAQAAAGAAPADDAFAEVDDAERAEDELLKQMQALVDEAGSDLDAMFESPREVAAAADGGADGAGREPERASVGAADEPGAAEAQSISDLDAALAEAGDDGFDGEFETVDQAAEAVVPQRSEVSQSQLAAAAVETDHDAVDEFVGDYVAPGDVAASGLGTGEPADGLVGGFDSPEEVAQSAGADGEAEEAVSGFEPDPLPDAAAEAVDPPAPAPPVELAKRAAGEQRAADSLGPRARKKPSDSASAERGTAPGEAYRVVTLRVPTFPNALRAARPLARRGADLSLWALGTVNRPARGLDPDLQRCVGWGALAVALPGVILLAYGLML